MLWSEWYPATGLGPWRLGPGLSGSVSEVGARSSPQACQAPATPWWSGKSLLKMGAQVPYLREGGNMNEVITKVVGAEK